MIKNAEGFTLLEIIITIVILSIISIPTSLMITGVVQAITYCQSLQAGLNLADREMATVNNLAYDDASLAVTSPPASVSCAVPSGYNYGVTRTASWAVAGQTSGPKKVVISVFPRGSARKLIELATYKINVKIGRGSQPLFNFFDHFENSPLDLTNWTAGGEGSYSYSIANSLLTYSVGPANYSISKITFNTLLSRNFEVRARVPAYTPYGFRIKILYNNGKGCYALMYKNPRGWYYLDFMTIGIGGAPGGFGGKGYSNPSGELKIKVRSGKADLYFNNQLLTPGGRGLPPINLKAGGITSTDMAAVSFEFSNAYMGQQSGNLDYAGIKQ